MLTNFDLGPFSMRDKVAVLRDTMIVLSMQLTFRFMMLMRICNY